MTKGKQRTEAELIGVLEIAPDGSIRDIETGKVYSECAVGAKGYMSVWVNKYRWYKHRVVWVLTNGPIPNGHVVDHIDGDVLNNSLSNLRLATMSQNAMNCRRRSDKSGTLPKGVCWIASKGRYASQLKVDGKRYQKLSKTLEEAVQWLKDKRHELHGEFARN